MNVSTQIPGQKQPIVFVGLDVHKNSIALAAKLQYRQEWLLEKNFGTEDLSKLAKFLEKIEREYGSVQCCYEASSSGFYLKKREQT